MVQTNETQENPWGNMSKEDIARLVVIALAVVGILYLLFRSSRAQVPEIAKSVASEALKSGLSIADIASMLDV